MHIYAIGCIGYMFIEILWRGYTHWTMGIVGGICFSIIYILEIKLVNTKLSIKAFYSALCVVIIELITGIIVNICFRLSVWDYSDMKFNILGQISLIYSVLWYFLCIPSHILCRILRRRIFGVLPSSSRQTTKIFERQP